MKKIKLFALLVLTTNLSYSQWVTKVVDNKIDEPYRIAYCSDRSNDVVLKLESLDTQLAMYVSSGYFCDEEITTDIAFIVNGLSKRYSIVGTTSSNNSTLFLVDDLNLLENQEMFKDFKSCTQVIIRVNETHCSSDTYTFTMTGSTNAAKFMSTR